MSDPTATPTSMPTTPDMTADDESRLERMIDDTSLMPHVVADTIIRDLAVHLHRTGQAPWLFDILNAESRDLAGILSKRAAAIYCANAEANTAFARDLRTTTGRDTLYAFTQHWLAGLLHERHGQAALDALPDGFASGHSLPGG